MPLNKTCQRGEAGFNSFSHKTLTGAEYTVTQPKGLRYWEGGAEELIFGKSQEGTADFMPDPAEY